jgi:MarR family transcriptional regulator, negative regulator of the multidrug operon emrRAB
MHISDRERRTANLLGAAALALTETLLANLDTGQSRAAALVHLKLRPGENIDFLARVVGLTHPAAVRLVDALVDDGLLERRAGRDRRTRSLVLTQAGKRAAARVVAEREQTLINALGPLSARERQVLAELLEKVLDSLTNSRWSSRHICRLCDYPTCARPSCPVDAAATRHEVAGAV